MRKLVLPALLLAACGAPDSGSSPAVAQANTGASLSADDRQAIYLTAGLTEKNGQWLDVCEQPAELETDLVDVNGDGEPEVFLKIHGICLGGGYGMHVTLLTRQADGGWKTHLGFPAGGYELAGTGPAGYADIRIHGMGSCSPVWRWNGATYDLHERCPDGQW